MIPIICVGETKEEHAAGRTMSVVKKMVLESIPASGNYIIAYEPRWAIGASVTPSDKDICAVHETICKTLKQIGRENIPIVYGGNVNPQNAASITKIPNVDGLLIGRASLKT